MLDKAFMTDEQILTMILEGEEQERAYRALMSKYQQMLYQHIMHMVNSHDDTNDILQNTFIKIFRNIGKFEKRSSLYTWIYRIASNESLNFLNKRKRIIAQSANGDKLNVLENNLQSDESPDPEEIRSLLSNAIDTLPAKQKCVFNLRYFEEMSYRDMAEVLETSEGALKASFHHAVKKIESYFKSVNIYG